MRLADVNLKYALGLPPEKAIRYFERKGLRITWDWHEMLDAAHAQAFTVAKVMQADVLQDIRDTTQHALETGMRREDYQVALESQLRAKGWWGKEPVLDAAGKVIGMKIDAPHRLATIYRTNLQSAYMAGRYKAQEDDIDNRPYWQYVAVLDARTRDEHAVLHGLVFRADDPFWSTHYPPNGFQCRCRVRALSERNIEQRGLTVESSTGRMSTERKTVSKRAGIYQDVQAYYDPRTGEKISPDPGFNYNPGRVKWKPEPMRNDPDLS